ncbi:3-(2,3-dihydroxyphenyl) propionic acid dioxygenase [Rhodococcus jostii RHA1]|uniref:2,3-dihydroxyphenylpropionate/2,3-dihydroxicinnamic acid 1,2-dioxygenase n=1 Tax=Rhodococcus jostii (strain RHA1) TaxID=101510 RepID=MHPB_RHOJR|nr:3-carboxyethylcatechol 2,3-dioxygenase [Rhodococcus jostii]Q0SJD2.1 RecName: Full=2,3-dihydroxyphenylpropionate/2,3-dihydroxicinnamic acid 1,2-dioxygenase; AltName: Full=3-carboxyethylcatechol 2,3-dioxygenase [Rhodococcus jostii RHA1]ABG92354.1 3-(2,3-dihydroxyphenyl) propionic acid dioxygenase [Rhodococcus jostii RHA1]
MPVALCTMSHSPLMGRNDPAQTVIDDVDAAFENARTFIADFAPDLIVIFAPDHYNGVYYDLMPPFCIGAAAQSVGDYGTESGPLNVDRDAAYTVAREVLASGVDVAFSERMHVDHGFAQALQLLVGSITAVPTVPIFINSVAEPLGPVSRVRLLGEAVGRAAANLDKRVLFVGSGGLSHDPPVPQFATAPTEVKEKLIDGRNPTEAERNAREQRVIDAGRDFAAGVATIAPLNPEWDRNLLDVLTSGEIEQIDSWTNEWFVEQAGHSSHEVRTWIAAYAAMSAAGKYRVTSTFYREIPEWIAGFGISTAVAVDE